MSEKIEKMMDRFNEHLNMDGAEIQRRVTVLLRDAALMGVETEGKSIKWIQDEIHRRMNS